MPTKDTIPNGKNSKRRFVLDTSHVAHAHTCLAFAAFTTALIVGSLCHYKKIVKNSVAGYPEEWFPSVSATIGDWYPERNLFQILIALTAGPRFALVFLQYYLNRTHTSNLPTLVFISGLVRTIACGGWVYITSSDDHDVHDFFMITYMVCNLPWMLGGIACTSPQSSPVRRKRQLVATAFFVAIIPLVYFFVQHKVHRIPGAYTRYSFFEWSLIFFDVLYDSISEEDFKHANLQFAVGFALHTNKSTDQVESNNHIPDPKQKQAIDNSLKSITTSARQTMSKKSSASTFLLTHWRPAISFMSDVYLSYIFWSIFTSLIPTLFYFSVWELGIAGQELALLATLSPVLLGISPLLSWARRREGIATLHLLSFSGLAAYLLKQPLHRLFVATFASAVAVLRQAVEWADGASHVNGSGYQGILMGLGLMLSSLSKHANHSNNPVWPLVNEASGGYNKTGLLLALATLYEVYTRPPNNRQSETQPRSGEKEHTEFSEHGLKAALPLGSLLFSLHTFLSDCSTLIAWSWTGYENWLPKGPVAHQHGSLTLIAQALGLLVPISLLSHSSNSIDLLLHPFWFIFGSLGSFVMLNYKNWLGYAGGLSHTVFLMSIIPSTIQRAAGSKRVAKTYFTAFAAYCLLDLASVWTVAYAFVPGGVYLRERTDLVLLAQMACLSLVFEWPRPSSRAVLSSTLAPQIRSYARTTLTFISVSAVLTTLYRWPSIGPQPFKPGLRMLNTGIWTLHFGMDNEGRDSQRLVRNVIRDMELDVVGLLETDLHRVTFGNRDLTRVMVEEMGYYVDLGPGPNMHTWGASLLSKFPIINSTHHLLPSPDGELAPAIEAVLDVYGTPVTVVVAHNGQEETRLDRELQSKELARIMTAAHPRPVIFLGYVVTKPHAARPAPYDILISDGKMHDIDKDDLDRWCEYIMYRGLYRTSYARLSRGIVTDTELQIGQFVLPRHGYTVVNETEEARYLRSFKEELPEYHWFPMAYYGNENHGGVNGHFYHVFHTPLYYKIPEDAIL